jgi:Na+-translocating ferredoxin:NAD+ oxidoreductase RnfD subunit
MISDPKTTPNARAGRIAYAALVALVGFTLQTFYYQSAGVIFALILCAPMVPLFDRIFKDQLYQWPAFNPSKSTQKGVSREISSKIPA